jgi:hypothetical protein
VFDASTNRMDCSQKQGTCVDEVQCNKGDAPPTM